MRDKRKELRIRALLFLALAAGAALLIAFFARRDTPEIARAPGPTRTETPAENAASATPRATPAPRDTRIALVFARSKSPASGLIVRAGSSEFTTDAEARIAPPSANERLQIIDAQSSLTLLQLDAAGTLPSILALPEPVRVTGRIARADGSRATGVTLRWGSGEPITPDERQRRETGSRIRPSPNEDMAWGIRIGQSPAGWESLQPTEDGSFTTPWFLAAGAEPQLIAFDPDGRWAAARLAWPDGMPPRTTLDAGAMAMADPAVLEVELEFPPGEIAADLGLGIREATILPEHEAQCALLLGVLDRVKPALGGFARGSGNLTMTRPGVLRYAPMPPLSNVTIIARGAVSERTPTRLVDFEPGKTTRIKFSAADLFPIGGATRRIDATLVLEGTDIPAEGVRVTYSGWRRSEEQITDALGRVVFASVPSESPATFQIDAFDERDPPRFSKSWTEDVLRAVEGVDPSASVAVKWSVPTFRWIVLPRAGLSGRGLPGGQPILAVETSEDGGRTWKPGEVADSSFTEEDLWLEVTRPALYRVVAASAPLVMRVSSEIPMGPDDYQAEGKWSTETAREISSARLTFIAPDGKPMRRASVILSGKFTGAYPLEIETDNEGVVVVTECNLREIRWMVMLGEETLEGLASVGSSGDVTVKVGAK